MSRAKELLADGYRSAVFWAGETGDLPYDPEAGLFLIHGRSLDRILFTTAFCGANLSKYDDRGLQAGGQDAGLS